MARKTRSEQLEIISRRIEASNRWRDELGYDRLWRRLLDLYRGKHWPSTSVNNEDLIAVNLAFSTVNVIAPSVSVNHPKITVSPNKQEDETRAVFVEAVINHVWRHYDFRSPFKRAVKDFLIFGHGWIKVGWKFVEQTRSLSDPERDIMAQEAIVEADVFAMENPDLAAGLPTDKEIIASVPHSEMSVVEDRPFAERVSPFDVIVDPEATCMEDIQWIAQRIVRPLEDVQNDRRFKPSVRKRLQADAYVDPMRPDTYRDDPNEYLSDEERVVIYEYYDIAENTISVCTQQADEFLLDPVAMPYAYGQPFVMIRNYDIPDYFYPMGDLEAIESLQEELDKTRSQMMNARKRYARKYLYHERSFGPAGREALEADEDGRLVPVVDENKPLSEVVIPMPQIPLSPEIYNMSAIIEDDISMVSGVNEYARGQMPEIRRTATEASIIADAANARAADKLAIVEQAITLIARRVLQVMQQYMTGEQMARVSTPAGESMFVPFVRDDIVGEYDFAVEGGSTQPLNDTIRKQQAVSLLNALGPMIGTVIDPYALARHVLQQGFGIKNPDKFLMEPPPQASPDQGGPVPPPPPGPGIPPGQVAPGPDGAFAPPGGVPPELVAQLQSQMGFDLANF